MKYDFLVYQPKTSGNKNFIKINKDYTMRFSKAFLVENKLENAKFVQFCYDRKNNAIALSFSNIQISNSFKIAELTKMIATQSAFKFAELYPKEGDYAYEKCDDGNRTLFIIKL